MEYAGIKYSEPKVILLQESGIGVSEVASRICYDSFDNSEHFSIRKLDSDFDNNINRVHSIEHSNLLDDLAWTYFHHSILEHVNLTYLIKGTSRGVLQEHARHRIQAISVRSTRYTMSSVINAFIASQLLDWNSDFNFFEVQINKLDMFVVSNTRADIYFMFQRLNEQRLSLGTSAFIDLCLSKSNLNVFSSHENSSAIEMYKALENGKKKRNVGDSFKHIVTDNWKVDMVVTFNLRSLKNYFTLRDSGAAYFQIRNLAKAMKDVTPKKYLDLIIKDK